MSTETWTVAAPQTLDVAGVTELRLRLVDGRAVVVVDPAAHAVEVEVREVGTRAVQVVREEERLRIGYDGTWVQGWWNRLRGVSDDAERAVVRITLPPSVRFDAGTVGADVDVTGTAGATVRTVTGSVRASDTSGTLTLRAVSGTLTVVGHAGDVAASVVSGTLSLGGGLGRVSVSTVSGAVTVAATGPAPLIDVRSVSGAVDVRLDEGTPVNLKVRGVSGKVVLDGSALASTGHTLAVDHADAPSEGRVPAYVSAALTSGRVTVTRGRA